MQVDNNTAKDWVKGMENLYNDNNIIGGEHHKILLEKGTAYTGYTRSSNHKKLKDAPPYMRAVKQCFYNCQQAAMQYGLRYWEGYAVNIIPTEHAWLTDKLGRKVYDITWECLGNKKYKEEIIPEYFGIRIPVDYIRQLWINTGQSTSLWKIYLDQYIEEQNARKG